MPPSYLIPKGISVEVKGETLTFYPLSIGEMCRLREIARPVCQALASLLVDNRQDRGEVYREWKGASARAIRDQNGKPTGEWEGENGSETTREAPALEVARLRSAERNEAIMQLTETLTNPKNLEALLFIVADSLREDFKRPFEKDPNFAELKAVDLSTLSSLLQGVFKANAEAMPPLAQRVMGQLGSLTLSEQNGSTSSGIRTAAAG